jgi:hypothetical protein
MSSSTWRMAGLCPNCVHRSVVRANFVAQVHDLVDQLVSKFCILLQGYAEPGFRPFARERGGKHLSDQAQPVDDVWRPRPFLTDGADHLPRRRAAR